MEPVDITNYENTEIYTRLSSKGFVITNIPFAESFESYKKKYIFKTKGKIYGIKPKYEKYKPHYSFANGEDEVKYEEFIIYSDNEERKEPAEKNILKNCYLKNDFFLYLNKKNTEKKISELKSKLFSRIYKNIRC